MTQKGIIAYYSTNGGLRCKDWTIDQIKKKIKADFGKRQRVYTDTCVDLKLLAQINSRL